MEDGRGVIGRTADRDADLVAVRVEDGDVDVGREVAAVQPRGEGLVHVVCVGVDIQLVA